MTKQNWFSIITFPVLATLFLQLGCDGKARELAKGSSLGDAVIEDGDGERTDGSDFGQIYPVTTIVQATADWSGVVAGNLPSVRPVRAFDNTSANGQWPFEFRFNYPANNYKLGEAHLVFVASRDVSDTEAIYVGNGSTGIGVGTGRPPGTDMQATALMPLRFYECVGACGTGATSVTPYNRYIMDFSLTHYKVATENSFDVDLAAVVAQPSPGTLGMTVLDVVKDGWVRVNLFDDLAVLSSGSQNYASPPLLFMDGFTVSKTALSCSASPTFKFVNTYIHNDGNSLGSGGTTAFTGTVYHPYQSYGTVGASGNSVEFFFDPKLPRISTLNDLNLNAASLNLTIQRGTTGFAAIVINGVGISETGFDRTTATSVVESWDDTAGTNSAWTTFLTGVPAGTMSVQSLNLVDLLGASRVKTLLNQGKFNVALSGSIGRVYGQNSTALRSYGTAVAGPELRMRGDYTAQICTVPNDPTSPLNDSTAIGGSCDLDGTSPAVSSIQAANVTSTGASIQWLSDEPSDSQVAYGLTGPTALTTLATANVSFHTVTLTGLQPYRYYQYTVKSKDACGNETTSSIKTFRTLR